jgi:hypothetical protein
VGRTTGQTEGRISNVDVKLVTDLGYTLEHQIELYSWNTPISQGGDSGSVWITDDLYAGLLHFGGNGKDVAYATPISWVFQSFGLNLWSNGRSVEAYEAGEVKTADGIFGKGEIEEKVVSHCKANIKSGEAVALEA